MHALPLTLATLPEYPSINEVMRFQVSGLMVVFLALGSIWLLVDIVGRCFVASAARQAARAKSAAAPSPSLASPAPTPDELSPAVVAAIAAAVHVTLGPRTRVAFVKPVRIDGDWAREGRRQIFASHRVR